MSTIAASASLSSSWGAFFYAQNGAITITANGADTITSGTGASGILAGAGTLTVQQAINEFHQLFNYSEKAIWDIKDSPGMGVMALTKVAPGKCSPSISAIN